MRGIAKSGPMKVHFHILFCRGASMRCTIELPYPPPGAAIRDVAQVFLHSGRVVRLPIWQHDGTEADLLVMPPDCLAGAELNIRATEMLRASLARHGAAPHDMLSDHTVRGIAILVESGCWP